MKTYLVSYDIFNPKRLKIAKYFIAQKVRKHSEHLGYVEKNLPAQSILEEVAQATSVESLMGIEGTFAKSVGRCFVRDN